MIDQGDGTVGGSCQKRQLLGSAGSLGCWMSFASALLPLLAPGSPHCESRSCLLLRGREPLIDSGGPLFQGSVLDQVVGWQVLGMLRVHLRREASLLFPGPNQKLDQPNAEVYLGCTTRRTTSQPQ